jgi:dihydroorotate dehydrogenase (NAD+) catalytic subunit
VALAAVHECHAAVGLPIVGMGGIASADDARDFLAAGASAVAVGTALFRDPGLAGRIRRELEEADEGVAGEARLHPAVTSS